MRRWGWLLILGVLFAGLSSAQSLPLEVAQGHLNVAVIRGGAAPDETHVLGIQQLPWKWDSSFARQRGIMHFRFEFVLTDALASDIKTAGTGLGLSSLNMGNRYRYRINNSQWTELGWSESTTQFRVIPRWNLLTANALRAGNNVLELEIKAEPASDSGLSIIELDLVTPSLARHLREVYKRYATALVVGTLSTIVCLLSLAMWRLNRDKFFLITALAEAFFALRQADWLVDYPPVPTWVFNTGRSVIFAYYAGLTCWISVLLVNKHSPSLDRFIRLYLWAALPVLVAGAAFGEYRVYQIFWNAFTLLLVGTCVARLSYYSWRGSDMTVYLYTAASWLALSFGVHDYLLEIFPSGFGQVKLGNYSFLLFNFGLGLVVVRKYWESQDSLQLLRLTRDQQTKQAALLERQRMMQDIHDSVGSQLVALLGLVNSNAPREQVSAHTSDALDELRLAVDAIDNVDGDLAVVLATLRHRLQPRLVAANLQLRWQVDALPKFDKLTPKDIQHIQRILLEVFSNIIQHAKAKEVVISARYDAAARVCRISISDDGKGFDASATTGRGLSNMQSRADMLGAALSIIQNNPHGMSVNLGITVS